MLGAEAGEKARNLQHWISFDAAECNCFDPDDKARIMGVIRSSDGGIEGFNRFVMELMREMLPEGLGEEALHARTSVCDSARTNVDEITESCIASSPHTQATAGAD